MPPASVEPGLSDGAMTEDEDAHFVVFAQKAATWLDGLNTEAKSSGRSLPALLTERFPLNAATRTSMLEAVPWDSKHGYTTMLRYPKGKCKGVLHIASFDYTEHGLHGKGLYAGGDAVLWLRTVQSLDLKRLGLVPVVALAPMEPAWLHSAMERAGRW